MNQLAPEQRPGVRPKPVVLCILDGFGWRAETDDNAVAQALAPTWKRLFAQGPRAFLKTSGPAVGLPEGQMGNSEVGHMNIGAGRVLVQDLDRIGTAIAEGTLAENPALRAVLGAARAAGGAVHILGLLSPGGVHSHQDHIVALAQIAAGAGLAVWLHPFLDGRDTPPQSARAYLTAVQAALGPVPGVRFGTIGGRFFGMDRDQRWERVAAAYAALVAAEGPKAATAEAAIAAGYAAGETDEFITPRVLAGYPGLSDGDALLMANFRADRARQILTALLDPAFSGFARTKIPNLSAAAGMTEYSEALAPLLPALFPPVAVPNALGEVLAGAGLSQLRLAETEKYAHVTFFFNGGRETVFPGEVRILVPSPKVRTYDLKPEMSAPEVTEKLVAAIDGGTFDVIVVNYANADQVGHSGVMAAAVQAVEAVDRCLAEVAAAVTRASGVMLVTADHGNVEIMRDPATGAPHTAHTTLDVPLLLCNARVLGPGIALRDGRLADLAPTLLDILGLAPPPEMTGRSLLLRAPVLAGSHAAR